MHHAWQFDVADIEGPRPLHQAIEVRPRHYLADIGIRPVEHRERVSLFQIPTVMPCVRRVPRGGRLDGIDNRLIAGCSGNSLPEKVARESALDRGRRFASANPAPPSAFPACKKPHCSALRSRNGRLQIGDLATIGQSLDGLDGTHCFVLHREYQAGAHDLAIDTHRARARRPHARSRYVYRSVSDARAGKSARLSRGQHRGIDTPRHLRRAKWIWEPSNQGLPRGSSGPGKQARDTQRVNRTLARCRRMAGVA